MNRNKLKTYAPQARRDFIQAVTDRAAVYGLTSDKIEKITEQGDVAIIGGKPFPISVADKRRRLEERVRRHGFDHVMEAMAYTWFNRLVAIRYMEIHGYLDHGYRVLSNTDATKSSPEIVEHAEHVDLPGLDKAKVVDLKLDGTKESELYQMLLMAQCHALHKAMPFLFERIDDETELLLPDNLLHSDSIIRKLVNEIEEADWQQVEIIGWLYQFYISEKKDEVIGKMVKSEDIPAATQLFTPNWIVKYLVQNSLGRQWLATYPQSSLRQTMEFYIEPAEQTQEVQNQLKAITPESLNPEELTLMDPACGSGHILVEAYDLLKEIYLERGYRLRDIPNLILSKNLFGLEIDERAKQLAAFALMMKARADDRRIFEGERGQPGPQPNVLAIQESNGLPVDAIVQAFTEKKITNEGDIVAGEFGFMGALRAPLFATENSATATVDDKLAADLKGVFALFENAKTFGSLIIIPDELVKRLPKIAAALHESLLGPNLAVERASRIASTFVTQASLLASRYHTVVTNPPYMGGKFMTPLLKAFVQSNYDGYEKDLFSCFVVRSRSLARQSGYLGFMSPFTWMFIGSYEQFRQMLLTDATLTSLIQLEYSGFAEATVPICTFAFQNTHIYHYTASFIRLSDFRGSENQGPKTLEAIKQPSCGWRYAAIPDQFTRIPGSPIAYWVPESVPRAFERTKPLDHYATPRKGMCTRDNRAFVRAWTEVAFCRIGIGAESRDASVASGKRWFPYQKGGDCRNWYGNHDWVVDWENDGYRLLNMEMLGYSGGSTNHNLEYIFKPSLVWSKITSSRPSFRYSPHGFLFDDASGLCPIKSAEHEKFILGFLCSCVGHYFGKLINPTLNIQPGNMAVLPIVFPTSNDDSVVRELLELSKNDWDALERSWDYAIDPLVQLGAGSMTLRDAFGRWSSVCDRRAARMRELEEGNNELFIKLYELQGILSPSIPDEQMCFIRANKQEDMGRLLSYAVGCAMGRYNLDKPGLIYANSGNEGFDPSQYKTFPADKDGIIPATEIDWFPDSAACRFEEFVAVAWPKEHLDENLKFVAESLGPKGDEQSRDTIRRYFANDFYKQHLQTYKRRPIYWLFTSGKLGAFQCLVYLHRYNEGTLARMRTEYVIPLQGKINARIDQLDGDKAGAASAAHRRRLEKEQELLKKHQIELQKFDEKLRHYADQSSDKLKLDLDDGVKANYAKFGDLLAFVTQVCGKGDDEE